MHSGDLQPWQAEKIKNSLAPHLGYLHRLQRRMEQVGFPPTDPLYQLVSRAYDATHQVSVEIHNLSCRSGVGRNRRRYSG